MIEHITAITEKHIVFPYNDSYYCAPLCILAQMEPLTRLFRIDALTEAEREAFYRDNLSMDSIKEITECIALHPEQFISFLKVCKLYGKEESRNNGNETQSDKEIATQSFPYAPADISPARAAARA